MDICGTHIHVPVMSLRFKETPPERRSGAAEALPADIGMEAGSEDVRPILEDLP